MTKYYSARKPVNDFLNKITEFPFNMTIEEENMYLEKIAEIYTESTNTTRLHFLQSDIFDIVRVFAKYWKETNPKEPQDYHRNVAFVTRHVLIGLIDIADQYGVRLSESTIRRYEDVDFGICSFAHYLRDKYKSINPNTGEAITLEDKQNMIQPDTDPANIFNACIAYSNRIYAQTIREELKNICKGMGAAVVVKCFAVCVSEKILIRCPKLAQAHEIQPNLKLEKPSTYNEPVKRYFDEDKCMVKNEADFKHKAFYVQIQRELKPLLEKLQESKQARQ